MRWIFHEQGKVEGVFLKETKVLGGIMRGFYYDSLIEHLVVEFINRNDSKGLYLENPIFL